VSALPTPPVADPAAATWVVCLCAEWCGTCRDYRPVLERIAVAHPGLRFAWVDIEDHAELADDFDVETFPTLLVTGPGGTHFLGPLLPHAETLSRMLGALPAAQPSSADVGMLMAAVGATPERFEL
jgi:thiol-disulfide isomerase/thioredoxin